MQLREYQKNAVNHLLTSISRQRKSNPGAASVLLVSPTGSGKTVMALELKNRAAKAGLTVEALAHRVELVEQLQTRLEVPAASIQGILASSATRPTIQPGASSGAAVLLVDEAHHIVAPEWKRALDAYPHVKAIIGLTATPQRADGTPLGNVFREMVVAAQYPELVRAGHLVPVRILRPDSYTAPDLGLDPVDTYLQHCRDQRAFCFARDVAASKALAERFNAAGVRAAHVDAKTPTQARKLAVDLFRNWGVDVLCNCFLFTEGLDVPEASTCIIARGCGYAGTYLQMVGRVLRPHRSKKWATLIDCVGASWLHGSPIARRKYTLERGIELEAVVDVRDCPQCGWAGPARVVTCPKCQWDFFENSKRKRKPKYLAKDVEEYWAGPDTCPKAKARQWTFLLSRAQAAPTLTVSWALRKYKDLFDELPEVAKDPELRYLCMLQDAERSLELGSKPGRALYLFKDTFGDSCSKGEMWTHWRNVKKELKNG